MKTFIANLGHYLTGFAVIGTVGALTALGDVSSSAGLAVITGVGAALIGGGIAGSSAIIATTPKP